MAAENDIPELAARATTESLSGGLPVSDVAEGVGGSLSGRVVRTTSGDELSGEDSETGRVVATELTKLSQSWRFKGFSPQLMREALHGVVFPKQQPGLVLLYPQQSDPWYQPSSLGLELVRFSVAAGEADTLAKELEQHRSKPAAELPAAALQVMLAIEQKRLADATRPLQLIAEKVQQPRAGVASVAAQAAAIAFGHDELATEALPILEALAKASPNSSPSTRLLDKLGGYYAKAGQPDKLRSLYNQYLDARQGNYARYGDVESAVRQQVSDLATATTGVARAGDVRLTLDFLGRFTDIPATTSPGVASPLWDIDWQLLAARWRAAMPCSRNGRCPPRNAARSALSRQAPRDCRFPRPSFLRDANPPRRRRDRPAQQL